MRIFVALVPPASAVEHLAEFLEPRQEAGPELRWTDPHQWHVTLAFMPRVAERSVDALLRSVDEAGAGSPVMQLRIFGGGAFPNAAAARVLWAGVDGPDDLSALARRIRGTASHAGGAPQGGPFHPHVTLARWKRAAEGTRWVRVVQEYAGPAWSAEDVAVVESHLGEGRGHRPRYEVLARAPLGAPGTVGGMGVADSSGPGGRPRQDSNLRPRD